MKLNFHLLVLLLVLLSPVSYAQVISWQFEEISDDVQESGANPHMVVDGLGNLHLAYWQKNIDRLIYGFRNKNTAVWNFQPVPDVGTFGYKSSLKVNNQGVVYLAYLRNLGGDAGLGLAIYDGNTWTIENASQGTTIGEYGYDSSFPTLIQPSLDINFDGFGEPAILYFNGFFSRIKDCAIDNSIDRIYSQYRMDMNVFARRGPDQWEEIRLPNIPYTGSQPCVENGDRFGEFCQFLKPNDSTWIAITNALHNNELLLFRSHDDSLKNWQPFVMDQSSRLFPILNSSFYEGFGYIDATLTNDSLVHITYNVSNHYGYSRRLLQNRLTAFYTRVNLNRLDEAGYQPYRFNFSPTELGAFDNTISAQGDSTVVMAFFERLEGFALSATSFDAGQTWTLDTLQGFLTNAPLQSAIVGDTVFIAGYFSPGNRLMLAKKPLQGGSWRIENVTQSLTTGDHVSAHVFEEGGDRKIILASQTEETDRLIFWENENGSWKSEAIDISGGGIDQMDMTRDEQGRPLVAYIAQDSQEIRLARRENPNDWSVEVMTDTFLVKDLSLQRFGDRLHLIFFNLREGYLQHLTRSGAQVNWSSAVVDSSSALVGSAASSRIDALGGLHVSYVDLIQNQVKYAYRPEGGNWTVEGITAPTLYLPKTTAIALDTGQVAHIAFADAQKDSIFLLDPMAGGGWRIDRLEGQYTDFSGDEVSLLIDDQNQPWILYNYQTFVEDLRLYYRNNTDFWQQVSIVANSAEISNVFEFLRFERDLYIIGRKNQTDNRGLGLLVSENGIAADLSEIEEAHVFHLAPNPAGERVFLNWESDISARAGITLYNLSGQEVYHKKETGIRKGDKTELRLEGLKAGIYLLSIELSGRRYTRRLVVLP